MQKNLHDIEHINYHFYNKTKKNLKFLNKKNCKESKIRKTLLKSSNIFKYKVI